MGDASRRDVTSIRREYRLPNPTNWVELSKAVAWAERDLRHIERTYDDTVTVSADDDDIILSYSLDDYPDVGGAK